MTNDNIRELVIAQVRRDIEAHKLSDRALPVMIKINIIYPQARTELVVDIGAIAQEGRGII